MDQPKKDETWIAYVAYKLRHDYLVMPEVNRFQLATFLVEILESPHDRVDVAVGSSVGFSAEHDFFVRYTAPTAKEIQDICIKVLNSGLGRYLQVVVNWVGHLDEGVPMPEGEGSSEWMGVYPVTLCRKYFALEESQRTEWMTDYKKAGDSHEAVRQRVDRSFGAGDPETLVSWETTSLEAYEAFQRSLRNVEMHRYLGRPQKALLGRVTTAYQALEMAGAL